MNEILKKFNNELSIELERIKKIYTIDIETKLTIFEGFNDIEISIYYNNKFVNLITNKSLDVITAETSDKLITILSCLYYLNN